MKKIYSIWCEWDIGEEGNFFTTEQKAIDFAKELWQFQNMEEEVEYTFDEAIQNGLLSINKIHLDDE